MVHGKQKRMGDNRLNILAEARRVLEEQGGSPVEREYLLKLLDILTAALGDYSPESAESTQQLVRGLIDNRALLSMLKQQTDELDALKKLSINLTASLDLPDELDALKKLSINLTSSLDLPDVLDAVVSEAMRLIENAHDINIFLYKNHKLSFGAALDSDGTRNKPWSKPRSNGLTYTVAHGGDTVIVEDMQNHPLFRSAPKDWVGSIIGIPLKVGDMVVGVMNLSRSTLGAGKIH